MSALRIGSHQSLVVVSSDADRLIVVTTYEPGGSAPPAHYHPQQDEEFEVLAGTVRADVDGQQRDLSSGDTLTVTRGQVHKMWNPGAESARVRWVTSPALSTLQWFAGLDRLQLNSDGKPDTLAFARLASRHRDSYRLVLGGPKPVGDVVVGVLALVARVFGR